MLNPLNRLLDCWDQLKENERRVLITLAQRLLAGQRQYGGVYAGKKDWDYETFEENLDASIYQAMAYCERTGQWDSEEVIEVDDSDFVEIEESPAEEPQPGHRWCPECTSGR